MKPLPLLLILGLALFSHAVRADEPPASTCFHESPISIPKDKLVHLDNPNRVPNAYLVGLKCDKALAQNATDFAAHRSQALTQGSLPQKLHVANGSTGSIAEVVHPR
jgi:hypothetical protein